MNLRRKIERLRKKIGPTQAWRHKDPADMTNGDVFEFVKHKAKELGVSERPEIAPLLKEFEQALHEGRCTNDVESRCIDAILKTRGSTNVQQGDDE